MKDWLLLDIGGVLLVDAIPEIFQEIAEHPDELQHYYQEFLRQPLWTGQISEFDFWQAVLNYCKREANIDYWRAQFMNKLQPLEAMQHISALQQEYNLAILSNHRSEWVFPRFQQLQVSDYFSDILISDRIKMLKPDEEIFTYALDYLDVASSKITFVDDKQRNILAARQLKLKTINAADNPRWWEDLLAAPALG